MPVLVAEDNPVFQSMLRSLLGKWGYEPLVARDGNEAWRMLESAGAPRLAILDWMMPGVDGVELCRRVRAVRREPYVYILLLTARTDSQDLVEGMEAGADDYLTKPFNAHELRVRLRAGRRILDLQEELLRAREALRQQATHDDLTGLLNRVTVLEQLQNEAERCAREGKPLALLMADLDRFKQVNDTHGHLAGDAVLREASQRMQAVLGRYDVSGRYGGEEFLIILPGCDCRTARAHAERLRAAICADSFAATADPLHVTCSIGVSCRVKPTATQVDALIREADLALYMAKDHGRDRVETYYQQD